MYNGLPFFGFTLGALWGARVGFVCGLGAVGFRALITSGVGVGARTGGGGEGLGVMLGGGDCTASRSQ